MSFRILVLTSIIVSFVTDLFGTEVPTSRLRCDPSSNFLCRDSGNCILKFFLCDGLKDCDDGSDEESCPPYLCRFQNHFRCQNGFCVPSGWVCNEQEDCTDGSDERHCAVRPRRCPDDHFLCEKNGLCILRSLLCNGEMDCTNGADERNCVCQDHEYRCQNGHCIRQSSVCDGTIDCSDGGDERNCTARNTTAQCEHFRCASASTCIPHSWLCDGEQDCADGSDEINCQNRNRTSCDRNSYHCANNGQCLSRLRVCDGIHDCLDGSDETNCQHKFCDRCWNDSMVVPYVLFANRTRLQAVNLNTSSTTTIVRGTTSAIALDYDYSRKLIFWSDSRERAIYSSPFLYDNVTNEIQGPENAVKRRIAGVILADDLAVDWVHKLIYWTDEGSNKIEVATYDGSMRMVLFDEKDGLRKPRGIAVDPSSGWLFFTDWNNHYPRIEKSGMNGENRQVIVPRQYVYSPNDVTIDYATSRLYWIDARRKMLVLSDYNGNSRKIILNSRSELPHPFSLDVFQDHLYVSDWNLKRIIAVDKVHGNGTRTIIRNQDMIFGIKIFHQSKQPAMVNRCGLDNGGCSHLCLPAPVVCNLTSILYTCRCPTNYTMTIDNKRCTFVG